MILVCAVLALAVSTGPGGETAREGRSSLEGRWTLDAKESEDPKSKFTWSEGSEPAGGPVDPQRRARRPKPGSPEAEEEWARISEAVPAEFRGFLEAPSTLVIAADASSVPIDEGRGKALRLVPDGAVQREGPVSRVARWEGASLVIDSRIPDGTRLMSRYNPMPGGASIEVFSMLTDTRRHTVTLRRVYDAAEPAADSRPGPAGP
jgi:hypothetical protein